MKCEELGETSQYKAAKDCLPTKLVAIAEKRRPAAEELNRIRS